MFIDAKRSEPSRTDRQRVVLTKTGEPEGSPRRTSPASCAAGDVRVRPIAYCVFVAVSVFVSASAFA